MNSLRLKQQELPDSHPDANNMFAPGPDKPFVATTAAIDAYSQETIFCCLMILQQKAQEKNGLDYLQVFETDGRQENLWIIEDGPDGAITALLPSDY